MAQLQFFPSLWSFQVLLMIIENKRSPNCRGHLCKLPRLQNPKYVGQASKGNMRTGTVLSLTDHKEDKVFMMYWETDMVRRGLGHCTSYLSGKMALIRILAKQRKKLLKAVHCAGLVSAGCGFKSNPGWTSSQICKVLSISLKTLSF